MSEWLAGRKGRSYTRTGEHEGTARLRCWLGERDACSYTMSKLLAWREGRSYTRTALLAATEGDSCTTALLAGREGCMQLHDE